LIDFALFASLLQGKEAKIQTLAGKFPGGGEPGIFSAEPGINFAEPGIHGKS
jgi:hypothetical protein